MIPEAWLDLFPSARDLYLCGSYTVASALLALETAVLLARERTILGHLGWPSADEPPAPSPARATANREAPGD